MSPELERLLAALYESDTCEPAERPQRVTSLQRLIADILARRPGLMRQRLLDALRARYVKYRHARRKPPTMPPRA